MRVTILNRYYPPDLSPTGYAAHQLAKALAAKPDLHVTVITTDAAYAHGISTDRDNPAVDVVRVRSFYNGRNPLLRLLGSLFDGWRMARAAPASTDVIISLTDPPLLVFWAGRAARRRGIPWVEWTMDLFPEAFVAAGLAGPSNTVVQWLLRDFRRHLPSFRICLGINQRDFVDRTRGTVPTVIWPYGATGAPMLPVQPRHGPLPIIYAGNLGEAHDPAFVVRLVELADPTKFIFWLSPRGAHAEALKAALSEHGHVRFFTRISDAQFAEAAVHIVSLRPQWTHVCVPSKAIGAVSSGKPILFAGDPASDNWAMLENAGWIVPNEDGKYADSAIQKVLAAIADEGELSARTASAAAVGKRLKDLEASAIAEITACLREVRRSVAGQLSC